MDILIDFDGTCVKHAFPDVGENIGAEQVLKELVASGHRLILFTMRSDNGDMECSTEHDEIHPVGGPYLTRAIEWFKSHDVPLFGIQCHPTQHTWTTSPKAYGHIMIDDSAVGCPLRKDHPKARPYVDWRIVAKILRFQGILPPLPPWEMF